MDFDEFATGKLRKRFRKR